MKSLNDKILTDTFRDKDIILALAEKIQQETKSLEEKVYIMEVCGGHTHTLMKYGLTNLLPSLIQCVHGPGCPVCIMPKNRINQAYEIAMMPNIILLTLGDMLKVPGSNGSLQNARSKGAQIGFLYSPFQALEVAKKNPSKKVVYFAIGFETTTPMTAALLQRAIESKITNLYFHINHVLVPPPLYAILDSKDSKINALLAPSHVSAIAGSKIYEPIFEKYQIPIVVGGFEPVDVMQSILMIIKQVKNKTPKLEIEYSRVVTREGNKKAQELVNTFMQTREDFEWRGLGNIPHSALALKKEFSQYDAEVIFDPYLSKEKINDNRACRCGDILKGVAKPYDCKVFGKSCTPDNPLGSCMVSSEGACAAYYKYGALR